MSKANKEQIIEEFTQAYQKAHGKTPEIESKSGWYTVDGGKNMRIGQLEEMTKELGGSSSSDAATKKPASKSKTQSKAKPAKKQNKTASSGFSVKDFYAQKLQDENPGSTLPR